MLIISRMLIILPMLACCILSGGEIPVKHYSALATIRVGGEARFILLLWWKVLWVRAVRICRSPAVHSNCTMDAGHHSLVADSWIGCDGRGIKQKGSAETCSWWCSSSCFHSYPCCACNRFWSYSTPEQQERLWQTVPCSYITWSPFSWSIYSIWFKAPTAAYTVLTQSLRGG